MVILPTTSPAGAGHFHVHWWAPPVGCFVEIGVQGDVNKALLNAAFDQACLLHRMIDPFNPTSDISRINQADGQPVKVHPLTGVLLRVAARLTRRTAGRFNCTTGGILESCGLLPKGPNASLLLGTADDLEFRGLSVRLRRPIHLSLQGIDRGYAVDLVVKTLMSQGGLAGWVKIGDVMRVFGGLSLPVHRYEYNGYPRPMGIVRDAAFASSMSSSVVAERAWLAEALARIASLSRAEERQSLVADQGGWLIGAPPFSSPQRFGDGQSETISMNSPCFDFVTKLVIQETP